MSRLTIYLMLATIMIQIGAIVWSMWFVKRALCVANRTHNNHVKGRCLAALSYLRRI